MEERPPRPDWTNGTHGTNRTYEPHRLIPAHGGYRKLKSYQTAEIIYDATVAFCDRFIDRRSRTHDQMVQAARSGKQNIAEGGFTERLYRARREHRDHPLPRDGTDRNYEPGERQAGVVPWVL